MTAGGSLDDQNCTKCFTTGKTAQEIGLSHLPNRYIIDDPLLRPSLKPVEADVPVIDLAGLQGTQDQRTHTIQAIKQACLRLGFFQVVNHGIPQQVLDSALDSARGFFNSPIEERLKYMSSDVKDPVRYATSLKDGVDKIQFWRIFLKHYAHPLDKWIHHWPDNPSNYRENMGKYTTETRKLALQLTRAITESLGLGPEYLGHKMDEGMQVMALNCYPPCPKPEEALGLPPHSDYSCLTLVHQSSPGLEIMDFQDHKWKLVPPIKGALQVHLGDHFEALSNGVYRSVIHRATLNSEKTRFSIASFHSLGMEEKMCTADELVNEQRPKGYKASSFQDFINFLSNNDIAAGKSFLDTIKIDLSS